MDLQSEPFNYSKIPSWVLTEKYPVSFDEKQSCVGFPAHESIPLFLWEMLSFGWNLFSKTEFQKVKQLLKIPLSYSCNTMKSLGPRNKHEYLFNWYSSMHRLIGTGRILEYYVGWMATLSNKSFLSFIQLNGCLYLNDFVTVLSQTKCSLSMVYSNFLNVFHPNFSNTYSFCYLSLW